jgi:hypothetical protein
MMCLGPDKFTISKLDNIELREIIGITRSKLNSSIRSSSKQEQSLNKNIK